MPVSRTVARRGYAALSAVLTLSAATGLLALHFPGLALSSHVLTRAVMIGCPIFVLYSLWTQRHVPRLGVSRPLTPLAILALGSIVAGLAGMLFGSLSWVAAPAQHAAMIGFTRCLLLLSIGCGTLFLLWGGFVAGRMYLARH